MDELPISAFESKFYYIYCMAKQMNSIEGWNTAKDISFICIFADKY